MDQGLENGFEWLASHLRPKKVKKVDKKAKKDSDHAEKPHEHEVEKKSASQDSSSEESSSWSCWSDDTKGLTGLDSV